MAQGAPRDRHRDQVGYGGERGVDSPASAARRTPEGKRHDEGIDPVLVVIPTYNERENLPQILQRLHEANPSAHALVVDDGSPDGTGALADELAAADERVHVMHRSEKAGLGAAYIAGFRWGLAREYATLVEMDADGSHAPEDLPRILDALGDADLVLGSRYVPGGSVVNWPLRRELLSRGANLYSKLVLGTRINDITAGYRAYRRPLLEKLALDEVASHGYCFQIDLAWRTVRAGFTVIEVPITFTEREIGESKMSGSIVREAMFRVGYWGVRHRIEQVRKLLSRKG
jgi:dolichol-phosphate mannosyltransferase